MSHLDDTTRRAIPRPLSESSIKVRKVVTESLSAVSDPQSAAVAIDVAINAGIDAVAAAKQRRIERENVLLRRDLAESRASEQVFRAEVTRLRERLGKVER